MTPSPTRLGQLAPKPNGPAGTLVSRALAGGRRGENVDIPLLGRARIEIVGATAQQEIEAAVWRTMKARELELNMVTAERYELERAILTLAEAVRDPDDRGKPFGTAAEWGQLDTDVVHLAWQVYGDVRERLDPMATVLTDEERLAIKIAIQKKDAPLLRSFGIARLSAWLASTDGLLSTSPTPSSPSSDSSSVP